MCNMPKRDVDCVRSRICVLQVSSFRHEFEVSAKSKTACDHVLRLADCRFEGLLRTMPAEKSG